jgi:ABC-type phosphate/phosphonate transport system permease subunit
MPSLRSRAPRAAGRWLLALLLVTIVAAVVAASGALAAGGKPATKLVNVADTRQMEGGFTKFVADLYNDNLLLFGLLVVVVMATMGAVLGFAFDKVFALIGIDLGKIEHRE